MTTTLPELKELAHEIKIRRRRLLDAEGGKPVTQRKLAEACGIRQSMMAKIESGSVMPSYALLKRVLDELAQLENKGDKQAWKLMHRGIIGVGLHEPLRKASDLMTRHDVSQLVVYDGKEVVGSMTDRGVLGAMAGGRKDLKVADALEAPFPMVDESSPRSVFASLVINGRAVIVTKKGVPVGIITRADVI
jgi:predicted transcriptional regulator